MSDKEALADIEAQVTVVCDLLWNHGVYMKDSTPLARSIVAALADVREAALVRCIESLLPIIPYASDTTTGEPSRRRARAERNALIDAARHLLAHGTRWPEDSTKGHAWSGSHYPGRSKPPGAGGLW